jgi:lipopolysaccharide transport system ATP-binding protein
MTSTATPALSVQGVTKTFRVHHERANSLKQFIAAGGRNRYEEFYALRDVSFDVREGEAFGVIGHNGSGKSTLLKCMAGILQPTSGNIHVSKRMSALLELGAGFHPELSGRDNVFLNAAILGMPRREIAGRFDEIVDFSGLAQFIDTPVKTYSSGMYVRLAFAVAINVDPEILLIDEILAVGDVTFQQKCMEKFAQFREEGRTLVLVTHDLGSVRNFCDRAIWLDHGTISGEGAPTELVDRYTETMLSDDGGDHIIEGGRRGTGVVRIERVELLVRDRPAFRLSTGDCATFRLHYHASVAVPDCVFSIQLARLGGAVVTAPSSRHAGVPAGVPAGSGVVEIAMDDIALLPGAHILHTEILDVGRQQVLDHVHTALRFEVMPGDSNETDGVVTMRPRWSLNGAPPSPEPEGG